MSAHVSGVVRQAPPRRGATELLRRAREPLFWLAVVAIGLEGQRQVLVDFEGSDGARIRLALAAAICTVALAVCRRYPLATLLTIAAGLFVSVFDDPQTTVYAPAFGIIFAGFALGRRSDDRIPLIGVAVAGTLLIGGEVLDGHESSVGSVVASVLLTVIAPVGLGRAVRERAATHDALRARAAVDEAARRDGAARALLDERARIAGELHDVVAHALSAMVVQAGAARVLAARDPGSAAGAFASVERTGRDALFEIRSLLGVLRSADDEQALEPQPTLEHLPQLLRRSASNGLAVRLETVGEPRALGAGASLTAYRATQEALRVAREDGGAREAVVTVAHEPTAVRVAVDDDGRGDRGPLAVRERVLLYGGELTVARVPDEAPERRGWHRTAVRLPRGAAA